MQTKQRRVVVTEMGVVTPLGHDPDNFYEELLKGVSGISEIDTFDCSSYPTRIAGEIKSFSSDGWVAPKLSKRMDKFMLYLLPARRHWKMVDLPKRLCVGWRRQNVEFSFGLCGSSSLQFAVLSSVCCPTSRVVLAGGGILLVAANQDFQSVHSKVFDEMSQSQKDL